VVAKELVASLHDSGQGLGRGPLSGSARAGVIGETKQKISGDPQGTGQLDNRLCFDAVSSPMLDFIQMFLM
jgi:hypothetical protein